MVDGFPHSITCTRFPEADGHPATTPSYLASNYSPKLANRDPILLTPLETCSEAQRFVLGSRLYTNPRPGPPALFRLPEIPVVERVDHLAVSQTLLCSKFWNHRLPAPPQGVYGHLQWWLGSGVITGIEGDKNRLDLLRRGMNSPILNGWMPDCFIVLLKNKMCI